MEDSLGSSDAVGVPKKSRSLDLKTLYKSSISNDSVSKSLKRKNSPGNDGGKQDKRIRKVVSLSSFKQVDSEDDKLVDNACNGTTVLESLEDSSVGLCDSNGLGLAGSMIYVPRRRRDFVGRSRFENGLVQKSAGESGSQEELLDKLFKEAGEESSAQDQLSKAEEEDCGKEVKESDSVAQLQLENVHSDPLPVKDDQLVVKQKPCNSRKRKSSASSRRAGNNEAKSSSGRISKVSQEDDEENLEANAARMLSSRFDPNCTQFPLNPVTPGSPSASRLNPLSSGKNSAAPQSELFSSKSVSDDPDDRSLRPRRQLDGKSKVRRRRHFYEISYSDVDSHWLLNKQIKVLWPLDENWYHGFVDGYDGDKNLHHVKYDDRDEEWINLQGERFKILLFPSEVPGKNLRKGSSSDSKSTPKIKGNDKSSEDEEKQKVKLEDDCCMGDMESEPIIKWLARSMHRDKSSTLKAVRRWKKSEIMTSDEPLKMNGDVVRGTTGQYTDRSASSLPSCGPSVNESLLEGSGFCKSSIYPLVYYRRRLHTAKKGIYKGSGENSVEQLHVSKYPDPEVEFLPFEDSGLLEIYCPWNDRVPVELSLSLQVVSLMNYFFLADLDRLSRVALLLRHGTLVILWPRVCLEMIFLNNQDGLRYLIFEGCIMEAVQLIFHILTVVDHSNKQGVQGADADLNSPVSSIGLQVSFVPGLQRQFAFQFYSFHEVKNLKWSYLEHNFRRHSLLVKQVSTSECTPDNMKAMQKVMQKRSRHGISSGFVSRRSSSVEALPISACYKKQSTPPFALHFTSRPPTLFLNLHLEMVRELGQDSAECLGTERNLVTDGGCDLADSGPTTTSSRGQEAQESGDLHDTQRQHLGFNSENGMSCSSSVVRHKHETRSNVAMNGINIQVPVSDHSEDGALQSRNLASNIQGSTSSPKATAPRSMWQRSKSSLNGHLSHGWSDSKGEFLHTNLGSGPKKRRTQVSYSLPSGGSDSRNKGSLHKGLPNKRIRRSAADVSVRRQKDLESSFCDANVLVTLGDRGWREYGAQIFLEPFDKNEWKLAVKISGATKYSHRAHQFLQPGSTNRFTHAMMWKGGKDWTLEFPDRGQWFLFKEMHEECYNRNTRAALVRNIPIPGIRMIEADSSDGTEAEFIRSCSKYYRQTETDVEMALDPSRVLYDMDSDDEQCLARIRECSDAENSASCEMSEDMFEKAMDMLEKASYVKQRDHFTSIEIQELMAGVGSLEAMETTIYEHWRTKRQRKGMPLIRHLQPPLWEKYQREVKKWELVMSKANTPNSNGSSQMKESPGEKPAMFAFCFKPRGLEVKHRGTKHRSHQKKLSVYAQYHSNTLGNGADNPLSPAHNCYNTSGPSLTEHTPSFAFQFFPNKEEAVNDVDSGVSECLSDGASRMVFDTHGRVDYGSSDRKPVVDFSSARGIGFNCESNSSVPLPSAKPYNRFDSHFADNCSSSFQGNKAAPVNVKPEAESEKLVCSSVPKEESNFDPVYAPGETSHWWSGASGCSVSYQTDIQEGFAFMAQQTGFPSQDSGNSSNFYVAADPSSATQINGYVDSLTQVNQEHIQPRSVDYNFSNASLESVQSLSPESISDSDDDSDVYIIETNGQSANPYRPLAMKIPVVSSQYSPSGHTFNQPGGTRLQSNKENMIFQAALQDLSLPEAEANLPDGVLAVPLMRHQRIALSWMAHKETTGFPCSGGILADDQGLGKTISTIALILKERSTPSRTCEESIKKEVFDLESEGGECASSKPNGQSEQVDGNSVDKVRGRPAAGTLVVCPTSVMRQWGDEIRKKVTTEAKLSVLVYHGSSRTKDPHELAKYDVVVTTYSIVSMEVPKQPLVYDEDEEKDDLHNGEGAAAGLCQNKKRKYPPDSQKKGSKKKKRLDRASAEAQSGPLAKVSWFRVVLDEAQSIKNHKTQVARACWGLRAKRRWCLSGTPIQNSIDDLYSYFRFLKYDPYSSYVWFCNSIKNPVAKTPVKGYQKLQAILKTVMLRRTKGSLIDGKPIISLPPKSIELRKVEFTEEERDFYSNLEKESRSQFQEYKEAGTVKQNYVNILLMLLRLRQACDHPLLVKGEYSFTWESSLGLAKKENFSEASLQICGICNDSPEDAVVSVCGHVFCKQCFYECLTGDDNICPIANCNGRLSAMPSMHDNATSVHVETVDSCSEGLPYESSKIKAALEILQSLARPQDLTDIKQITQKGADSSLSATPLKVVGEKAIVFSQWTKMLDLLEASLISSRIQYRRLDGTMSVAARDKAVQDFNTLPEVTVMIMSLKAASLGLNMVAACHVLMLDLWWNPTTEDQAIDRAHRIGQTRPVTVVRFTVKETVEDRILALQQKKRMMVASAFGEDEKGSRQSHLTVEDLNYLFMAD